MALTPEQRILRRKYIGSSDAAAIAGVDTMRSAYDIWMDKRGMLEDTDSNNIVLRYGNYLEPAMLKFAAEEYKLKFETDIMKVHANGFMCANLDGIGADFIVEAKSTNMPDEWGEEHSDQIPERVMIQVHHQFLVCGPTYKIAYVPVILPAGGRWMMKMFVVERDDNLCNVIEQLNTQFWHDHVLANVPPPDAAPSQQALARRIRKPELVLDFTGSDIGKIYAWARYHHGKMDKFYEAVKEAVIAELGEAEVATCGEYKISYTNTKRKSIDFDLLRVHEPEIYKKYVKVTTSRRLNVSGPKVKDEEYVGKTQPDYLGGKLPRIEGYASKPVGGDLRSLPTGNSETLG